MQKVQRKFLAGIVSLAILALVSGFCYGTSASAAMPERNDMAKMDMSHCSGQITMLEQGTPMHNSMMPCCVDRHDNVPSLVPQVEKQSVKFLPSAVIPGLMQTIKNVQQKTYIHMVPGIRFVRRAVLVPGLLVVHGFAAGQGHQQGKARPHPQ